jgi:restriction endonuclease
MLREGGDGTAREVDILISHVFIGTKINIAIECRGRGRVQDIEWIDNLAGKYKRLNINQVIAVSPTQFTAGAREKAAEERIELLTVEDASKVDWASRLAKEAFSVGTHRNILLNVSMWSSEGNEITLTTIDPDTNIVTHKDRRSELLYPYLVNTFMQKLRAAVEDQIFEMIKTDLSKFFREPHPRYCELTWENAGEIQSTEGDPPIPFAKIIFGIGTTFQTATAPVTHKVLKDWMLSEFKTLPVANQILTFRFITSRDGVVIHYGLSGGN